VAPDGHPVAATGAIIATKVRYDKERDNQKLGLVSLSIGGGRGMAILLERD
jgi:acetyl-CoA C-acetyltransferase